MSEQLELQIRRVAAAFSKTLDTETYETYFDALKHYPINLVRKAVDACIAQETFFPPPAVVIQAIHAERQRNPPQPDKSCPECDGTGFTRVFLKRDADAMAKKGYRLGMSTSEMIAKGMLQTVLEADANQPGVYSFAKKCQAC